MDCPKCGGMYLSKNGILDYEWAGGHRLLITWEVFCTDCGHEYVIEEEFESTGWEKIKEE